MYKQCLLLIIAISACTTRSGNDKITKPDTTPEQQEISSNVKTLQCSHANLSNQFNIQLECKRYADTTQIIDSCVVKLIIVNKSTGLRADSIFLSSAFYYESMFGNCGDVTSYSSGLHTDRKITDNYFGDLVIADLNFDAKDDIAIINDSGGSNGPLYSYFIQQDNLHFTAERFLTDSMTFFPAVIDKKKKRLTTYSLYGACCMCEDVYQYITATGNWKRIKQIIHGE